MAGGISFDDAVDAIEEVAPIKNNAKETFVNATGGNGDNAVGGNLSYQGVTQVGEVVLPKVKSYEQAWNKAFDIIGDLGYDSKPLYGRLKSNKGNGKIIEGSQQMED